MSEPLSLDIAEILKILPHRYPFLLVDRVTEMVPGERVKAYKNLTFNEPFFQGHFPGVPVMPGVLIIEALAQAGVLLVVESTPQFKDNPDGQEENGAANHCRNNSGNAAAVRGFPIVACAGNCGVAEVCVGGFLGAATFASFRRGDDVRLQRVARVGGL